MSTTAKNSLRAVMPKTASLVDELRAAFGDTLVDNLLRRGKVGQGGFYAAEIGPDGVFREYGSTQGGRHCHVVGGRVEWA